MNVTVNFSRVTVGFGRVTLVFGEGYGKFWWDNERECIIIISGSRVNPEW